MSPTLTGYDGGVGEIVIGTSSWADPGFVEEWYPEGLPARDRLGWYAERFSGVEVNSTFYALPAARTVARWAEVTPAGFTFDVKLHRLLSRHSAGEDSLPRDLRSSVRLGPRGRVILSDRLEAELCDRTLEALEALCASDKLACLLLQCSPGFAPQSHSLDELSGLVSRLAPWPVAIELRHRSWVGPKRIEETLAWFESVGAVWVAVDAPAGKSVTIMPPVDAVTNPSFAYLRAHGRNAKGYVSGRSVAERFAYRYSDKELKEIGSRAESLAEEAGEVRLMFNNNRGSDAPVAAERMRELAGQTAGARR
jgi:uncharacterized protein YecE (DUF72 family)